MDAPGKMAGYFGVPRVAGAMCTPIFWTHPPWHNYGWLTLMDGMVSLIKTSVTSALFQPELISCGTVSSSAKTIFVPLSGA